MWKRKTKPVNLSFDPRYPRLIPTIYDLIDTNNGGTSALVQSSADLPNRMNPSYVNNSIPPEQALRLYTQYIQEVFAFFY